MAKWIDITGRRFGRLIVISQQPKPEGRRKEGYWLCKCDCGNEIITNKDHLRQGDTKSCGCLKRELMSSAKIKHGQTKRGKTTDEYRAWACMKVRCLNPNSKFYYDYGGRGIKISERWLGEHGFENFFEDMGKRPSKKHSLDRFPNNESGHYEPGNCRWATKPEQSRGKRNNIWIEYNGERKILTDWAKVLKVKYPTLLFMYHTGKPFEQIVEYYKRKK
jgi:hypothetical protein